MPRRLTPIALLSVSLLTLSAEAESECIRPAYVWELELTRVEATAGDADLKAVATALGTQAILRGSTVDPARPKQPSTAQLVGSVDGAGLSVKLEKQLP
jgi:hypothetical protein